MFLWLYFGLTNTNEAVQSSIGEHPGQVNKAHIRVAHNACTRQPLTSARRADQKSVCINTNTFRRLYLQRIQLWFIWREGHRSAAISINTCCLQHHQVTKKEERRKRLIPKYRSEGQAGSSRHKELVRGGGGQSGSGHCAGGASLGHGHDYGASHPGGDRCHTPTFFLPGHHTCWPGNPRVSLLWNLQ